MVKKISKNSRAARQGLLDVAPRELEKLPRAENTDLTNIMIRTAAKNESLLEAKMRKKKDTKNKVGKKDLQKKINKTERILEKERLARALNITNRLDGKIAKSIQRAKYVQTSRKAGWDSTNEQIKRELQRAIDLENEAKANEEDKKEEGDIEIEEMYDSSKPTVEIKETSAPSVPQNLFDLLPAEIED
ncbi:Shuttling pre-60S factor ECM1 [Nakaseomyces bracarensis]|uniref:Shuttling pre-60S factor ECM1 n=1 Tax=Nakaseomyces bracarensis TaxID=273131 RepID=A0ABR4NM95_9SACH